LRGNEVCGVFSEEEEDLGEAFTEMESGGKDAH